MNRTGSVSLILRALLIVLIACTGASARFRGEGQFRVLFIGNSLTYSHDIPAIVAALAKAAQKKPLAFETIAFPDFSLEDHWNQGDAQRAIAREKWDVVVLQQGPSSLPESRILLREYVEKFAKEIRRAGAKPALYMVWPARNRPQDFDRSVESYKLAAADVDGILLPVGIAWRAALRRDPEVALYESDGLHPSLLGSYLAAWIIFDKLFGGSAAIPEKLKIESHVSKRIELTAGQLEIIRSAVREASLN